MIKNSQRQAVMYIGLGALIAIVILIAMGRLRTEQYKEASEQELMDFLEEVESSPSEEPSKAMGPSPMGEGAESDSD